MSTTSEKYFKKTIEALKMAAPFALASRFENGLAHCVEASICGAAALSANKITARAVPCAVVGSREGGTLALGLNAMDVYRRFKPHDGPLPSFEEWSADQTFPTGDCPTHMVIEACYQGDRAIIDLTIGQLRQALGVPVPVCMAYFGQGWQEFEVQGWTLHYEDSPHADEINKMASSVIHKGLTEDLEALMDIALQCNLNMDRFFAVLRSAQPADFQTARDRLARFLALAPSPT